MGNKRPPSSRSRWIWTAVLAVPVVAIIVATLYLTQQPLGRPPATPPPVALNDTGYTSFSEAGVEYATSARLVSVNASTLPIAASDLDLGDDDLVSVPASDLGNKLELALDGDLIELDPVGAVTVRSVGGLVTELTWTSIGGGIADVRAILLDDVGTFGLAAGQVNPLVSEVKRAQRDGEAYSATLEPATDLGVSVTPIVDCSADTYCEVMHVLELPTD